MPQWLQILNKSGSFVLAPQEVTYFQIGVKTSSAPPGSYDLEIQETIAGQTFETNLTVVIASLRI
jgi:hypothetical protein